MSSFSLLGSKGSFSSVGSSAEVLLTDSIFSRVGESFVSGSKKHRTAQMKVSTATMVYGKMI